MRLSIAMAFGCIPVIIQDLVVQVRKRGSRGPRIHSLSGFSNGLTAPCLLSLSHPCAQPLEDVLPYEEFSLRLSKSDIPHLADILRGVTEEEQARLRLGMAKWYQAFSWWVAFLQALHISSFLLQQARILSTLLTHGAHDVC
jgi:hypothetical protein